MIDFLSRASSPLKNRPVRAPGLKYMAISEEILSAACPHAANETFFEQTASTATNPEAWDRHLADQRRLEARAT